MYVQAGRWQGSFLDAVPVWVEYQAMKVSVGLVPVGCPIAQLLHAFTCVDVLGSGGQQPLGGMFPSPSWQFPCICPCGSGLKPATVVDRGHGMGVNLAILLWQNVIAACPLLLFRICWCAYRLYPDGTSQNGNGGELLFICNPPLVTFKWDV